MAKYPHPSLFMSPCAAAAAGSALMTYPPMYHMGMEPIKAPQMRPFLRPTFSTSHTEKMIMPSVLAMP